MNQPDPTYRERYIHYRQLLGMGCDVMLTQDQAREVFTLLSTGHVAMQQNVELKREIIYWQECHLKLLEVSGQLTRMLQAINEKIRECQADEDNRTRLGHSQPVQAQEAAGAGETEVEVREAVREVSPAPDHHPTAHSPGISGRAGHVVKTGPADRSIGSQELW